MKYLGFLPFMLSVLMFAGCQSQSSSTDREQLELKEKEIELKEKQIELREMQLKKGNPASENNDSVHSSSFKKGFDTLVKIVGHPGSIDQNRTNAQRRSYVFVYVETDEPDIKEMPATESPNSGYNSRLIPNKIDMGSRLAVPHTYSYTSDITEISKDDSNKKYMLLDKFEKAILEKLAQINYFRNSEVNNSMEKTLGNTRAMIIYKKVYTFNSFQAAIEKRDQLRYPTSLN